MKGRSHTVEKRTVTTVPTSRDVVISPADREVIARCRLCSGDCGLLAFEKPLALAVVEAGGQLHLSRIVRVVDLEGPCGVCDDSKWLKRANRRDIALTTRKNQPSYTREWLYVFPLCGLSLSLFCNYLATLESFELNKPGQR